MTCVVVVAAAANAEELERRKQVWQEELDTMSEFLVIKSTEEQREEGVERLVDTAFVGECHVTHAGCSVCSVFLRLLFLVT